MLGFGALHKKAKSSSIQSLSMLSIPPTTNNQNSTSVSPTTTSPSTTVSDDDLLMDTLLHTPDFSGSLYVKIHNRGPTGKFVGKQKQGNQKEVWKKRWCILGNDVLLICKHAPLSKANNHQNNQSNSQSMNGVDAYTHVVATVKLNGYKVLPLSSSETAVGGGFGFMIQPTQTKTQSEHHSARTSESGDPSNSLSPTLFFTSTSQYDTLTWINHLVRAASSHSSSDETGENTTTGGGKARLRSLIPIKHAQKMGSNVESHVEMGVESNVGLNVGLNVAQQQQQQLQPQQQQRRGSVIRTSIMSEPDHDTHTRSDTYNHPLTTTTYHQTSAPTRNFNGMNVNGGIVNGVNIKPVGAGAGVFARDNTPVRHLPWE
ncbi:hypothetical protein BC832DRAFT_550777 [Gaertneriomyces semiglobifer]|nr:hypothetical protein BC832DRAFT_550777 [Gaertneriomyces semiglobifer]